MKHAGLILADTQTSWRQRSINQKRNQNEHKKRKHAGLILADTQTSWRQRSINQKRNQNEHKKGNTHNPFSLAQCPLNVFPLCASVA